MVSTRRQFLQSVSAAAALPLLAPQLAFAAAAPARHALFDISLAQWSLHKRFFAKEGDPADFPKMAKEEFGIYGVEYVNQFYKEKATDEGYWKELKKRSDDLGVTNVLIMCDGEGALGDADEAKRKQAVENHKKWVAAAKILGCHSIRVNAQSSGSYQEQIQRAADGLRALSMVGAEHGISVIVENHGGLSSNGAWLAKVMEAVNHPGCGTLPDFGNFWVRHNVAYDKYLGTGELMPFAKGVSAKSHDFNDAGDEIHTDFRKMMQIVLAHGYKGFVGIEYEGGKISEPDGIKATKALLEKIRDEISK